MTRVKICGIQQREHAIVAAESGADFIGLVFVPQRRRRLELGAARAIVSDLKTHGNNPPKVVGLFADQPLEEVNQVIRTCQLDLVQLCGQESPDYCGRVEAGVIKVFHVPGTGPGDVTRLAENIQRFRAAGHLVTLDRLVDGLPGGTGQKFDWEIAAQLSQQGHSFLLAGGLTPDNVAHGVATVKPWGVDVSSGVETDGVKDSKKIRAFVRSAKQSIP
jgi:phosphoribosylanthranilate isomerase